MYKPHPHLLLKGISPPPLRLPRLPRPPKLRQLRHLRTIHISREYSRKRPPTDSPSADPQSAQSGPQPTHTSPTRYSITTFPGSTFTIHRGSGNYQPHTLFPDACGNPAHQLPVVRRAYMPKLREADFSLERAAVLAGSRPQDHRIDIPELTHEGLRHDVAFKLGVEYLSAAVGRFAQRRRERLLDGYVHGVARPRVLVAAPVLRVVEGEAGTPRWVFFVVDSVTPWTFLSKQAMQKLGIPPTDGTPVTVTINGYEHPVHGSPEGSGFEELSVLGTDFMRRLSAYQTIDWKTRSANVYIGRGGMPHFSELRISGLTPAKDEDTGPARFEAREQEDEGQEEVEVVEDEEEWQSRWKSRWMGTEWEGVKLFEGEGGVRGE